MKLHTAPQHAAEMNGIGQVSSFSIKATAKSFNILSSGLYANKIRAILRELGCNALDSHVAAGHAHRPWDLHLPTQLEPWFAIRDYGTGLTHDQVVNIYTTYFESTKTHSNDFIGALGLGSKSPFSYTDNFTVTAVKDGRRGIYTAYIDDQGVPAIALMLEDATDEHNGVEVKFAVANAQDFNRFRYEALTVYSYFAVKPLVNVSNFEFEQTKYAQRDLIPGVHRVDKGPSRAVMGNIAYPLDVPNPEDNLGDLHSLLSCSLELHFNIGELDFQASREGLSYIPATIAAIRNRLTEVKTSLYTILAKDAEGYTNLWQRALFLSKQMEDPLWKAAAAQYVTDTKFDLISISSHRWDRLKQWQWRSDQLAQDFNIALTGFSKYRNDPAARTVKGTVHTTKDINGQVSSQEIWTIAIADGVYFANNTTGVGAGERGRYHWNLNRNTIETVQSTVYIISPADKTKPAKFAEFMAAMRNPHRQCNVADWAKKPKKTSERSGASPIPILKLVENGRNYWGRRRSANEMVWKDAGTSDTFDPKETYYYLPLTGYTLITQHTNVDAKDLATSVLFCGAGFGIKEIYGVRKADLEWVKLQKNWINVEERVKTLLHSPTPAMIDSIAVDIYKHAHGALPQLRNIVPLIKDSDSEFVKALQTVSDIVPNTEYVAYTIHSLCRRYGVDERRHLPQLAKDRADGIAKTFERYPMIKLVSKVSGFEQIIADYVNLVDQTINKEMNND